MSVVTNDLELAVAALRQGRLVAFPTETVYGLGADAINGAAVGRVFEVKGRPVTHPLIVHLASGDHVANWADLDDRQQRAVRLLADAFWPGPLSIVIPRSALAASETVGGRETIGLRVPDHPVALALLEAFGGGVAGPSANRFGGVSPTTAAHVIEDLGPLVDVVLDGGPTHVGLESTIVELVGEQPLLLRPGAVTKDQLQAVLGTDVVDGRDGSARASGMLRSHYAPSATVEVVTPNELRSVELDASTGVIAPGPINHEPSWQLPADADGYARHLYASLRAADGHGVERLLIVPPAEGRLLEAVLDRLTKAAAPRP